MNKSLTLKKKFKAYSLGKEAEKIALDYLVSQKWSIIAHNLKTIYGEIDIIARKNNILVAFEIKTRTNTEFLDYSLSKKQQLRIIRAFKDFLSNNSDFLSLYLRFDAILIDANKKIKHIENAWEDNNDSPI